MTADAHHDEVKHDYHLVDPSPWPAVGAVSAFLLTFGTVLYMHPDMLGQGMTPTLTGLGPWLFIPGFLMILLTMWFWWRDVIREATVEGHHTPVVQIGMRYGNPSIKSAIRQLTRWDDAVHRLRGDVLRRLLLGLLQFQPVPETRSARLAARGCPGIAGLPGSVHEHADPAAVGLHGDMGASCAAGRRPEGNDHRSGPDDYSRHRVYQLPSV